MNRQLQPGKKEKENQSMLEQLIIIFSNLLFLLIGYYLGYERSDIKVAEDVKKKIINQTKKTLLKAGIIDYPTQGEIDYRESGEEKVDEAREKVFREQFKP